MRTYIAVSDVWRRDQQTKKTASLRVDGGEKITQMVMKIYLVAKASWVLKITGIN
jgi:hypothetical protein